MSQIAIPILYALLAWWLSTGIILYAIGLSRRTYPISLFIAGCLMLGALWFLGEHRNSTSLRDAYYAFTGALIVWGFVEMTFLTGIVTGSRTKPCPHGAEGWPRVRYATQTVIHHELALAAAGLAIFAMTWRGSNMVALSTFAVLWVMRLSSKFNLFLGVPTLNDELLPRQLRYLSSYFRRAKMNALFPFSIIGAAAATALLIRSALEDDASEFEITGFMLLASLLFLALLEHIFMILPVSIAKLWGLQPEATRPGAAGYKFNSEELLEGAASLNTQQAGIRRPACSDSKTAPGNEGSHIKS